MASASRRLPLPERLSFGPGRGQRRLCLVFHTCCCARASKPSSSISSSTCFFTYYPACSLLTGRNPPSLQTNLTSRGLCCRHTEEVKKVLSQTGFKDVLFASTGLLTRSHCEESPVSSEAQSRAADSGGTQSGEKGERRARSWARSGPEKLICI